MKFASTVDDPIGPVDGIWWCSLNPIEEKKKACCSSGSGLVEVTDVAGSGPWDVMGVALSVEDALLTRMSEITSNC